MKSIKDELQHIILGDESPGQGSELKKTQTFLRRYAQASRNAQKQQYIKSEEAKAVLAFAELVNLITLSVLQPMACVVTTVFGRFFFHPVMPTKVGIPRAK